MVFQHLEDWAIDQQFMADIGDIIHPLGTSRFFKEISSDIGIEVAKNWHVAGTGEINWMDGLVLQSLAVLAFVSEPAMLTVMGISPSMHKYPP